MRPFSFDFKRDNKWNNILRAQPSVKQLEYLDLGGRSPVKKVFEFDQPIVAPLSVATHPLELEHEKVATPKQKESSIKKVSMKRELRAEKLKRKQKDKDRSPPLASRVAGTTNNTAENAEIMSERMAVGGKQTQQRIPPFVFKPQFRLNERDQPETIGDEPAAAEEEDDIELQENAGDSGQLQIPGDINLDISSVQNESRHGLAIESGSPM